MTQITSTTHLTFYGQYFIEVKNQILYSLTMQKQCFTKEAEGSCE